MPYKKKAPARKKKFIGGALAAAKRKAKKPLLTGRVSSAAMKKAAAGAKARRATQAKNMAGLSADQRNLLGQAQAHAFKQGKGTKAINDYTKKYGLTKAGAAAGKAAASKARKEAAAKRLISKGNPLAGKKRSDLGRIIKTIPTTPRKKSPLAMSRAAREALKKKQMEAMRGRSGRRIKQRPARGGVLSRMKRVITGGRARPAVMPKKGTAAYNQMMARRRAAAARRRPSTLSRAAAARRRAAAAARRRVATRPRRVGRPTTRRAVSPSRRVGRPALRRPVARRAVRRVMRRR